MTFSTPLKIIVACFAVAALLVATTMNGSESAGLKGSRKLQMPVGLSPADTVASIIGNSNNIIASILPPPPPPPPLGDATIAVNTIQTETLRNFELFNP
jgi:hypothetical protein